MLPDWPHRIVLRQLEHQINFDVPIADFDIAGLLVQGVDPNREAFTIEIDRPIPPFRIAVRDDHVYEDQWSI